MKKCWLRRAKRLEVATKLDVAIAKEYFRTATTGNAANKPHPGIYQMACRSLAIAPESALAVEDSFSRVRAAKAAGLYCMTIPGDQDPKRLLSAGADLVITDFRQLTLDEIERWLRTQQGQCA